jgi:CheY-like chemotaxis protein
MKAATSAKRAVASPASGGVFRDSWQTQTEAWPMVREWLIGGSRYGPNGQNLGPVSSEWFSQHTEPDNGFFVNEGQSVLSLVVEGSLDTGKGSGLPVRLWGCRIRIADESVMALEMVHANSPDTVLLDLALPRRNGLRLAQRLRKKPRFNNADLIAMRSNGQETGLRNHEPDVDFHLVKTVNPAELRELLAALEAKNLATAL